MSFAFFPWYTGDYLRDTRHLTPQKHGIYLLLLAHCWDSKGPAPLDEQECAGICNCRSADEIDSLRYVLQRFFVRMEDGWYQPRLHRELQKAEAISSNRAEAGRQGGLARAAKTQANAKQVLSKCLANANEIQANAKQVSVTPTPTPTPIYKTKDIHTPPKAPRLAFQAAAYLSEKGIEPGLIAEWLAIRKRKKLTDSKTAFDAIEREARAAGISLQGALKRCVIESWGGFKADWLLNHEGNRK